MQLIEEVVVPEHVRKKNAGVQCDFCGKIAPEYEWEYTDEDGNAAVGLSIVECETRTSIDDEETITSFDLCPECFDYVITQAMAMQGVKPTIVKG